MFATASNIILFIIGFGLLIFVHELGHFLAAKWAGIRTEAFAIGFGNVAMAWRKGLGLTIGSTRKAVIRRTGKPPEELTDDELRRHGLGETEYSLRWLPLGGFVKMLGQEDLNPAADSADPRSYTQCPVGKRMVVVSAGVIMNVLTAFALLMIVFLVGIDRPAPVIGTVQPGAPAALAMPINADQAGTATPGLQPGDRVTTLDGEPTRSFIDITLATAMGRPDVPVHLTVQRPGVNEPLQFAITPTKSALMGGLMSIGVEPAQSTTIAERDQQGAVEHLLETSGLAQAGIKPGMTLQSVNGQSITTYQQLAALADQSNGEALNTQWVTLDKTGNPVGEPIEIALDVQPQYQALRYPPPVPEGQWNYEEGLLGMTPLARIRQVTADSPNQDILQSGDLVMRIGDLDAPRMADVHRVIGAKANETVAMHVRRNGERIEVDAQVNANGKVGVFLEHAWDVPVIAQPMNVVAEPREDGQSLHARPSVIAPLELHGLTEIVAVNDTAVSNWRSLRAALREQTAEAASRQADAVVNLTIMHPTPQREQQTLSLAIDGEHVQALHELGWRPAVSAGVFAPLTTVLDAGGNPLTAVVMGVEETWKFMLNVYLTIDRLIRGTVPVTELRGPVGIIHLGAQVAHMGLIPMLFLLAVISANLAVLNFLPFPIVDGGLFLFLIYEKFKGRPPSPAFQNAAALLGILLIASLFIVVTWNDVMRLIG